jgi:hypothetical protein
MFGLSLPEGDKDVSLSRALLLVRQAILAPATQSVRPLGAILPDVNLLMFIHGDIRTLGVDTLLQWKDLTSLMHISCGGTPQWQFTRCTLDPGLATTSDQHVLHLVVLPKGAQVTVRSLASNGNDLATVNLQDEVLLFCYQPTTAVVRCRDLPHLKFLLAINEGFPLTLADCYIGTISRVVRKSASPPDDHLAGLFATPPKKATRGLQSADSPA